MVSKAAGDLVLIYALLGHGLFGVTELRAFSAMRASVAYADSEEEFVRLCLRADGKANVYVGVNPRPLSFFDAAPNSWVRCSGRGKLEPTPADAPPPGRCASDGDIEFCTCVHFDIDPVRKGGVPATEEECQRAVSAGRELLADQLFSESGVLALSGNGASVIVPIRSVALDRDTETKVRAFHRTYRKDGPGFRSDNVSNPSRIMRAVGTLNLKGTPAEGRPHRRSKFLSEWSGQRSEEVSLMIEHIDCSSTSPQDSDAATPPAGTASIESMRRCQFFRHCMDRPTRVSEPEWFSLILNLIPFQNGSTLIHAISALDTSRYNPADTQARIRRYVEHGYKSTSCANLGFRCPKLGQCRAGTPMGLVAEDS